MRQMKDSGIEWIGEIPESWEVHRIKNHFSIISGSGFKTDYQGEESGDLPVCKASDISNAGHRLYGSANYISQEVGQKEGFSVIPAGSILFAKIGEAMKKNNRTLTMVDACADNNCQAMVPQNIHSEYAYYLFSCIDMQWFDNAGTIPCINNTKLLNFKMAYPNMDKQNRIADYLDKKCAEIDAIIAAKEKTNELLKEHRQSIIYEAVTKGLDPTVPMKDSGVEWIGEIPENWSVVALKRVAKPSTGMTPNKANPEYWDGDIPWFSSKDIKEFYLTDSEDHITEKAIEDCGLTLYDANSVVFCARSGILRHTFPVAVMKCQGTINQDLRVLTTANSVDPDFLMYYLRGMNNTIVTLYQKIGATVESIETDWLLYLPTVLPPIEEQRTIANGITARCDEINNLITTNDISIRKLKEYRQSVIYEAVTGKVVIW